MSTTLLHPAATQSGQIEITEPAVAVQMALDPTIRLTGLDAVLLRGIVALLRAQLDAADAEPDNRAMAAGLRRVHAAAEAIGVAGTDGSPRAAREMGRIAGLVQSTDTQAVRLALAMRIMSPEQRAQLNQLALAAADQHA